MSLNACEAYLLDIRKDEIWQLIYVQRLSQSKAYEKLVQKGLGWLGEQRFRDIITKWEIEEPEVWPLRSDYWSFPIGQDGHSHHSTQTSSESEHIVQRTDSAGRPISLREGSATNAEPYSGLNSSAGNLNGHQIQSLAEGLEALAEPPEDPIGKRLLNEAPDINFSRVPNRKSSPIVPNMSSPPSYTTSAPAFCAGCGEDHSFQPVFLYDASSSYTERGSIAQRDTKPVTHIFGYIISPTDTVEDRESRHSNK